MSRGEAEGGRAVGKEVGGGAGGGGKGGGGGRALVVAWSVRWLEVCGVSRGELSLGMWWGVTRRLDMMGSELGQGAGVRWDSATCGGII